MHYTPKKTAQYLVENKQAHYLFTVKANQPTLKSDIEQLNLHQASPDYETIDKGHGRIETRRIWTTTQLNGYLDFPYVRQVWCIQRHVFDCKNKTQRQEVVME
jgi:predicted transposase YbfD/YdcC